MFRPSKKFGILFFIAIIVLIPFQKSVAQQKTFKVVIDAGHGGHDTGTRGTGRMKKREKDIALAVAKLVAKKLQSIRGITPILTRKNDVFLELYQRAEIANKNKADLFVSIHCNANKNSRASGSETFVLGVHRNKDNLAVAKRENAVIKLEADNKLHYQGFDPDHPETFIGLTLMQEEFLDQSILLASMIQKEYIKHVKHKDRSVQQAGFAVLRLTYMPSVLTEIGFLTNPNEEKFLNSKTGQNKIATAIVNAIEQYKNYITFSSPTSIKTVKKTSSKTNSDKKTVVKTQKEKPKTIVRRHKPQTHNSKYKNVIFKVQLMATKNKIALLPKNFRGLKKLSMVKENGLYKYFSGYTSDFKKISEIKVRARKKLFKNAFIIAYFKGKRVPLQEVLNKK